VAFIDFSGAPAT